MVKHLHTELHLELQLPWAALDLGQDPRGVGQGHLPLGLLCKAQCHFCQPSAGVATLQPSLPVLCLSFPRPFLPGRRGREGNHRASAPRCQRWDRDRKGEVVQCVSSEGCFPGSMLLPMEVCMEMEVTDIAFHSF